MSSQGASRQSWSKWEWNEERRLYKRTLRDRKGRAIQEQWGQPPDSQAPRYASQSQSVVGAPDGEEESVYYTTSGPDNFQGVDYRDGMVTPTPQQPFIPPNVAPNVQSQSGLRAGQNAAYWYQSIPSGQTQHSGFPVQYAQATTYEYPQQFPTTYQQPTRTTPQRHVADQEDQEDQTALPEPQDWFDDPEAQVAPSRFQGQDETSTEKTTSLDSRAKYAAEGQESQAGSQFVNSNYGDSNPASKTTAIQHRSYASKNTRRQPAYYTSHPPTINSDLSDVEDDGAASERKDALSTMASDIVTSLPYNRSRKHSSTYRSENRLNMERRALGRDEPEQDNELSYTEYPVAGMKRYMAGSSLANRGVYSPMTTSLHQVPRNDPEEEDDSREQGDYSPEIDWSEPKVSDSGLGRGLSYSTSGKSVNTIYGFVLIAEVAAPNQEPQRYSYQQQQQQQPNTMAAKDSRKQRAIHPVDTNKREELLHLEFRVYNSTHFKKGAVFKVLWTEPLGGTATNVSAQTTTLDEESCIHRSKFGQNAYHSIRRFVIAKARDGHCMCVPILTYSEQGTLKQGVKPEDHAMVYTGNEPPELLPGEKERGLHKRPIRMESLTKRDKLNPRSRINYNKLYTVEHNVKVCFIGKIHDDSVARFFTDFKSTFDKEE